MPRDDLLHPCVRAAHHFRAVPLASPHHTLSPNLICLRLCQADIACITHRIRHNSGLFSPAPSLIHHAPTPPHSFPSPPPDEVTRITETEKDNSSLFDRNTENQKLTHDQIEELKRSGKVRGHVGLVSPSLPGWGPLAPADHILGLLSPSTAMPAMPTVDGMLSKPMLQRKPTKPVSNHLPRPDNNPATRNCPPRPCPQAGTEIIAALCSNSATFQVCGGGGR